jgi:hypothetical protein
MFCQGGPMQVSATLIAAQTAAREARAKLAMPQAAPQPGFATALDKTQGFSPLPLKQAAAPAPMAMAQAPQAAAPAPMGQHVNIVV